MHRQPLQPLKLDFDVVKATWTGNGGNCNQGFESRQRHASQQNIDEGVAPLFVCPNNVSVYL
jgi:hypothetical protein